MRKIVGIGVGENAAKMVWEHLKRKAGSELKEGETWFVSKDFWEGDCEFEVKILGDTVEVWLTCIHYGFWGDEENWKNLGKNLPSVWS